MNKTIYGLFKAKRLKSGLDYGGSSDLVKGVDVVVLCGEGGVAVTQPVHHGAAGDNDGGKQSADAVLKGWKLKTNSNRVMTLKKDLLLLTFLHTHPVSVLLR